MSLLSNHTWCCSQKKFGERFRQCVHLPAGLTTIGGVKSYTISDEWVHKLAQNLTCCQNVSIDKMNMAAPGCIAVHCTVQQRVACLQRMEWQRITLTRASSPLHSYTRKIREKALSATNSQSPIFWQRAIHRLTCFALATSHAAVLYLFTRSGKDDLSMCYGSYNQSVNRLQNGTLSIDFRQ